MHHLRRVFQRFVGSGVMFRRVATLLSGTAFAQLFGLAMTIPLARLYGPEQFGFFAIIQSVVAVGTTIASLRYDKAIVLPKTDLEARVLQRLASRSILIVSLLFSATMLAGSSWVSARYHNQALAYVLISGGLVVYMTSQIANRQFWLTRKTQFRAIASNRVIGSVAAGSFQILAALLTRSFVGLVVGLILGQMLTLLLVNRRIPDLRLPLPEEAPTMRAMAKRYKKMPLLDGPNALLDVIRTSGINVLIGNITVDGLGQYSMAYRATGAPGSLINGAIAQVFLQRMSVARHGEMRSLIRSILVRLGLVGIPVFVAYYLTAPTLLPFIFGSQWEDSGRLAQALVPWILMLTITAPLPNLFIVAERQGLLLAFNTLYTALPLTFLALSQWALIETVQALGWMMAACLGLLLLLAWFVAQQFDQVETTRRDDS